MRFRKILNDPLTHFLGAGALVFFLLSLASPAANDNRIVVDREGLLTFIQYRSKAFEPRTAAALLDALSAEDRDRLVRDYIREEALYREAEKLGLGDSDYVIRRRMVQKLEFMAEAAGSASVVDEETLRAYHNENRGAYALPPQSTFAHVFVSAVGKDAARLKTDAEEMLAQLRDGEAKFSDATGYGDRFLFHTNYVERTYDYVKSHFGDEAAAEIFSPEAPLARWRGPVISEHGAHLIFTAAVAPGRTPQFEDVKSRVAEDFHREKQREQTEKIVDAIVGEYAVKIDLEAPPSSGVERIVN